MGVYKKGINGPFSGKAGSVIGSKWRKVDYMRGISKPTHKPASEAQTAQREKFRILSAFLYPMAKLLKIGYSNEDVRFKTAYNIAFGYNLKWAVVLKDGKWKIDYSRIALSRGSLPKPVEATVEVTPEKKFLVRWSAEIKNSFISPEDKVNLVFYHENTVSHFLSTGCLERREGQALLDPPDIPEPGTWQCFMFYTSPYGDNSQTQYLGEIQTN
ncbi:DUF6266 family protein [Pararcticibacter amylolyticus]|uniref:Uncharacterized protein n=1 Tax=Pararcticibacter amylolyticus TaxID=2173175 RepID=A0A2U2PB13_9SPHI|nr:DUF6266 family protein [Pararcticibacter amylolyticus]PWG78309.1 hypothetical protein DDR33_22800 [Pararcticibacter amylolyticus]